MAIPPADQVQLYRMMVLIRRFEEGVAEAYAEGFIGGFTHLYIGQEAVATGAISALNHDDYVIDTYRDHGHAICRETPPRELMAELYGRSTGVCKGKGGSMHFFDAERYFLGGYGIVGGNLPIAAGVALAIQLRDEDRCIMCFFGDGATNQGVWHEAINLAKLWNLPVVFVCENNFYGIGTDVRFSSSHTEIYRRAQGYGIPGYQVNGMDVLAVREQCDEVVRRVREGSGPVLIEARCYRYQGHSMTDPGRYRSRAEEELWRKRDPIPRLGKHLVKEGFADQARLDDLHAEVDGIVREAMSFAEESPAPSPEALYEDLFAGTFERG
jgi:pyruvate dehydrogenase E1 component alpha subunit